MSETQRVPGAPPETSEAPVGKVLIIDDEANLRRTLARILQNAGCRTAEAGSGREALECIARERFDLVYLDIHMPEMTGIELLEQLRRSDAEIAVIILTGFGALQTAVDAVRLGALDYLLKPYDPAIIVARTRTVLQDQAARRRKGELRQRITELVFQQQALNAQQQALQAELDALERDLPDRPAGPAPAPNGPLRFIKVGRLVLDLHAQRATFGDRALALPPAAFDYLVALARRSPQVVDVKTLVSEAQGYIVGAAEARELAKWHVHTIRQALEDDLHHPRYLITVRGAGYRLIVD
jgi:DNA-binding response OmpR family regulator